MLGHLHHKVLMCIYYKKDQFFMGLDLYSSLETEMVAWNSKVRRKKEMEIRATAAV